MHSKKDLQSGQLYNYNPFWLSIVKYYEGNLVRYLNNDAWFHHQSKFDGLFVFMVFAFILNEVLLLVASKEKNVACSFSY